MFCMHVFFWQLHLPPVRQTPDVAIGHYMAAHNEHRGVRGDRQLCHELSIFLAGQAGERA